MRSCEGGDQNAVTHLVHVLADLPHEVVDLRPCGPHFDERIQQTGRPDDLFADNSTGLLELIVARSRAHVDRLIDRLLELVEFQRAVVECGGQSKPVLDQVALSGAIPAIHRADLRNCRMGLVDEDKPLLREVVQQTRRRVSRRATGQMPRVVLDAVAVAHRDEHLEVEVAALLEPLRLEQTHITAQLVQTIAQLLADRLDRAVSRVRRHDIVTSRVDRHAIHFANGLSAQPVYLGDTLDLVPKELHADRVELFRRRERCLRRRRAPGTCRDGSRGRCARIGFQPGSAAACRARSPAPSPP